MKCSNCGSEWHCAGNITACPFCGCDCMQPKSEIEAIYAAAAALPDAQAEERTAGYRMAAEYGHPEALYRYGVACESGTGEHKSRSRAMVYYRMAAVQGHAEAAYRLGACLRDRTRGTEAADQAYFWIRVAAELGSRNACRLLGDCYENGEGIPANPLRAAYWYTVAAEAGDFRAAYRLSLLYRDGRGVRENAAYAKYYAEIAYNGGIRAAERLLARSGEHIFSEVPARIEIRNRDEDRFELGYRAYTEGKYVLAVRLYELGAKDGYARAQNNLGVCYEKGQGVARDEATAAFWYGQAARSGYGMALLNLGDCYRAGRGVAVSPENAFSCYEAAAEDGFARAQYLLGNCYFTGDLTERNIPVALSWYEKAAVQGYGEAVERVSEIRADMTELYNRGVDAYEQGAYDTAVKFYRIAAEFGHRGAQCNLGYCYQNGQGCEKDMRLAVLYYRKAAEQESGVAEYNLAACYLRGEGGLRYDYSRAAELLERAVRHGAAEAAPLLEEIRNRRKKKIAQHIYAVSTVMLHRDARQVAEALKLRLIAAEMGNARAMYAMGCHYEFGFGVDMDEKKADAWYRRAYAAGYRSGSRMKSAMLRRMRRPSGFRAPATVPDPGPEVTE